MALDNLGQVNVNIIQEASKAFGVVPAAYATLIDLGTTKVYEHVLVINSLNNATNLKFGDSVITLPAVTNIAIDGFKHNGIVQYKYVLAPTLGTLHVIFW